ncbi:Inorganic phosphate transporter [Heracleum sosnowskyi]|uniref:Inorganic phosphate transporter n=1 Tax=Heracleum sosnowskyi TaxID=360622 RepID=A0AAD8HAF8_9APIA|nr:Inorganic phosphate transporter [Heracleum sosnowskyi]
MARDELKVLNALDVAKTQLYHFTAIVIAGMGFFTDAYDLFCISLVTKLLGRIYYHVDGYPKPGTLPPGVAAAVNGVAFVGTIAGQLFFGWLGDKMGRKRVYGMTLMIMVLVRLWGLEFWQAADYVWRIILMFGAIPAGMTYYWRMKMPETARYTALVAKNAKQAASDMSRVLQMDIVAEPDKVEEVTKKQFGLFSKEFLRRHGLHLLGTTSTWFLLDIAFYSSNLFQKDIFTNIGWLPPAKTMNAIEEVYKIARAQTLIALFSTVPGYWFTVAFIDRIGRFKIQLMGFFFMTVFMFALAIPYDHWTHKENRIGFVVMYSLTFFFSNFGPNATTFVVPAEIFPARLRSTCHGISAASGKAGAMVGAFGFLYASQSQDKTKTDKGYPAGIGMKNSLIVLGVINALGMLFTFLVPEPNGKSLEDMSQENVEEEEMESRPQHSRTVPV